MTTSAHPRGLLEAMLRRDRFIVGAALVSIVALAWAYILWLAADMTMSAMDMSGMRMIPVGRGMMAPTKSPWSAVEFLFVFLMGAVMMVGMMAPAIAPMILMYVNAGRKRTLEGHPYAATGWFAVGYFLAWTGFSLAATLAQWALQRLFLLDASMASPTVGLARPFSLQRASINGRRSRTFVWRNASRRFAF
jgi:predicted metal-binding membrane protein